MSSEKIEKLISVAKENLGKPYKYGAKPEDAPNFFDCSGFIQYIFKTVGVELPRTAIEQAIIGEEISLDKVNPGDLVFFKGEIGKYNKYFPQGIGHVAVCIGNGEIIHAKGERIADDVFNPQNIKEKGKVTTEGLDKVIQISNLIIIKRVIY